MKWLPTLLVLPFLAIACKKTESNENASTANFTITGVRDIDLSVTSNGSYTFPISVVPSGGGKDTVTLSTENIPGGVNAVFSPAQGITPFNSQVTVFTDYTTPGGSYPFKIKGIGRSGNRAYDINVTLAPYRGWKIGNDIYERESIIKDNGSATAYPVIRVTTARGGELRLSFAQGAGLPTTAGNYTIAGDTGRKTLQLSMYNGAHVWIATGRRTDGSSERATGAFTFDTLRKFTFKCFNVEMSDGLTKLPLDAIFSEQ